MSSVMNHTGDTCSGARGLSAPGRGGARGWGTGGGTRRVRLVREEGRDVSGQYGREGEWGGGGGRSNS